MAGRGPRQHHEGDSGEETGGIFRRLPFLRRSTRKGKSREEVVENVVDPSVRPTRGRAESEVMREIDPGYFLQDFDPLLHILKQVPEDVDESFLENHITMCDRQLDVVNAQLSRRVMESYESFVQGMKQMREVEDLLVGSTVVCKNGRRHLAKAQEDLVQGGLVILSKFRKKQLLLEMIQLLSKVKALMNMDTQMQEALASGDYPLAIKLGHDAVHMAPLFQPYRALSSLTYRMQESLPLIQQKVDGTLKAICREFNAVDYERVIMAYTHMGKPQALLHNVQECLLATVKTETKAMLVEGLGMSPKAPTTAHRKYKDLCMDLPAHQLFPCLLRTFEVCYDILRTLHAMLVWHASDSKAAANKDALALRNNLDQFRKTVWDLMQRRASIFLLNTQLTIFKIDQFLDIFYAATKFVGVGEDFSGVDAPNLRGSIKQRSKSYLDNFHRDNIEVLRMMLENDEWQRLPVPSGFSIDNIKELKSGRRGYGSEANPMSENTGFMPDENPFRSARELRKAEKEGILVSTTTTGDGPSPDDDEEEDVDPALRQDSIDEDQPGGVPVPKGKSFHQEKEEKERDVSGPVFTSTALNVVRFIGKYMHMMEIIRPAMVDPFVCLTQVFEFYFYVVFAFFSNSPQNALFIPDSDHHLTGKLRSTLIRIHEQFARGSLRPSHTSIVRDPTSTATGGNGVDTGEDGTATDGRSSEGEVRVTVNPVFLRSSVDIGNQLSLYGLTRRSVATESLLFLRDVLVSIRPKLEDLIPKANFNVLNHFYSHTIATVLDLRTYIYGNLSRMMIPMEQFSNTIATMKWDIRELGTANTPYVEVLLRDVRIFASRLASISLASDVREIIWRGVITHVMDDIVDGIARVRKCSNEGRALMSLDLQVLSNEFQTISRIRPTPRVERVDAYIKAFYLPESDITAWVRRYREDYSLRQIVNLVHCGCGAHMKKRQRNELLSVIEDIVDVTKREEWR